ncbi:MAG: TonB-dependent receptor, partial [Acidobacteriota bacterium]
FFSYEQYRQTTTTANGQTTVPTEAYRQGDFSCVNAGGAACGGATALPNLTKAGVAATDPLGRAIPQNGIYDPASTFSLPTGEVMRNLYPSSLIPVSSMDPVARKIQDMLPLARGPNATQLINNYAIPAYSNANRTTSPSVKIDHQISSSIKLSGYLGVTATTQPNGNGFNQAFTSALATRNKSTTARINYDQTLSPTVLLHVGIGYLYTYNPSIAKTFDQSAIGLRGYYADLFPNVTGIGSLTRGGNLVGLGVSGGSRLLWDQKPTANASLTWVKNNHNIKMGGEMVLEGFPSRNLAYGHGNFAFSAQQTSLPWENGQGLSSTTGFGYASFLVGNIIQLTISQPWTTRLGNRALGFFIQDSWKVTRKLTVEYGLRYDYQTYLQETYGRMQNASMSTPNPTVGGRLGATIFEGNLPGRCQCQFGKNYPLAFGPRLSMAYQITDKTVVRTGAGLSYGTAPENAQLSSNVGAFYALPAPGYGYAVVPDGMKAGNPAVAGNPYGLPAVTWPNFDAGQFPFRTPAGLPPNQPFIAQDRNAGRPPRILSWSFGLQREVLRNLVVEASYVGNRGVWWTAPALQDMNYNALQPKVLKDRYNLDIGLQADRDLLVAQLTSTAARNRGFATPAYPGMPLTQTVAQQLRPFPQFNQLNPYLGPPLGVTWYDSLQVKATQRYSHGLDLQGAFTWQKELTLGVNASTSYLTAGGSNIGVNDVFNRYNNKQISNLSRPFQFVLSATYITPKSPGTGTAMKLLSQAVRDWQIGAVLRYQSGTMIKTPNSNNALFAQLLQANGFFSTATTQNFVAGQSLFVSSLTGKEVDPNCKCFDPTRELVLNKAAWVDPAAGQFGVTSPFLNQYRWQRQPSEALNFGRNFRIAREGKVVLQVRAEFQNVLNRLFLSPPSAGNPATNTTSNGVTTNPFTSNALTAGYGFVNTTNGGAAQPRSGQLVGRITF